MSPESMPFKLLLCVFSVWVNPQQDLVIDYLVEENRRDCRIIEGMRPTAPRDD